VATYNVATAAPRAWRVWHRVTRQHRRQNAHQRQRRSAAANAPAASRLRRRRISAALSRKQAAIIKTKTGVAGHRSPRISAPAASTAWRWRIVCARRRQTSDRHLFWRRRRKRYQTRWVYALASPGAAAASPRGHRANVLLLFGAKTNRAYLCGAAQRRRSAFAGNAWRWRIIARRRCRRAARASGARPLRKQTLMRWLRIFMYAAVVAISLLGKRNIARRAKNRGAARQTNHQRRGSGVKHRGIGAAWRAVSRNERRGAKNEQRRRANVNVGKTSAALRRRVAWRINARSKIETGRASNGITPGGKPPLTLGHRGLKLV